MKLPNRKDLAAAADTADCEKLAAINVKRFAKVLDISRDSAWRSINRGDVAVIRLGKRVLVPTRELDRLLSEAKVRGK